MRISVPNYKQDHIDGLLQQNNVTPRAHFINMDYL